jgi:hypothetical protein
MKKIFLFIALAATCCFSGLRSQAQSSVSEEDTRASLEISKNIIKLIGALAKDFVDVKGDEITKTEDGTVVSGVKDMDDMQATNQYIMVKSGGAAYYIANYKEDSKKLTMSFAAFTGGIITLTNADGNFSVTQDTEKSSSSKLVYIMAVKGTKVGSYTMDTDAKEGTMIIGFL